MDSRCYRIGWNMASDDLDPLPAHRLSDLSMDVAKQEYPGATEQEQLILANVFINGYYDCFAKRDTRKTNKPR